MSALRRPSISMATPKNSDEGSRPDATVAPAVEPGARALQERLRGDLKGGPARRASGRIMLFIGGGIISIGYCAAAWALLARWMIDLAG